MKIEWIGHACFRMTSQRGLKVITDPYKTGHRDIIKYEPIGKSGDIVTVSHDHGDHNHIVSVSGNPVVIKDPGIHSVKGIEFKGIAVHHDRVKGAERGPNTIFTFSLDGIHFTHLGDLGHPLSPEQLKELDGTEVLYSPICGPAATLEFQETIDLWEKLNPRIVIPMHFNTIKCASPKYSAEDLIRLMPTTKRLGASELSLTKDQLPETTKILIFNHLR